MANKTIYEIFDTTTKEELYLKLKNNDKKVFPLKKIIEFMIEDRKLALSIKSVIGFSNYLKAHPLTENTGVKFVVVGSSNNVLVDKNINKMQLESYSLNELLADIYHKRMKGVFIITNADISKEQKLKISQLKNFLENNELTILTHRYDFKKNELTFICNNEEANNTELIFEKNILPKKEQYNTSEVQLEKYQEFIEYYSKRELLGKSLIFDEQEIRNLLKLSKQNLNQEHFSILKFDDNFNIVDIKTKYIGGINSCNIDKVTLLGEFLDKDINYFGIFHNHPSGSLNPSKNDKEVTSYIEKNLLALNKKLLEHFIVSEVGTISFSELGLLKAPKLVKEDIEKLHLAQNISQVTSWGARTGNNKSHGIAD